MDEDAFLLFNPFQHVGVFMRRVVIQDDMDLFIPWRLPLDFFQEFKKFLMPVLRVGFTHHVTCCNIQGGKQCAGTMAFIVMRHGAAAAFLNR
ncbi:hypothetical protein BJI67_13815 [Acidihalobacter aeolianus]|uniref:Uncharacterized protein n=1 Tax=Acidihalobacter aeolianus TaxID=2792603 RepID=A0A1D8KAK2_9GAMM|nr:hypothetical protein BJI67_13815 [Acidihalobacter aeolianus]